MKIIVFGATGGTGRLLVQQALAAGHEVTAAARRPENITTVGDRLHKVRCDTFAPASVAEAVAGHDCIVSALGATSPLGPTSVLSTGIKHILAGARESGVRRVLAISSAGVDGTTRVPPHIGLFANLVIRPLLFGIYVDSARMEGMLETSDTDWTVVRPPRLTHGPATAAYRMAIGTHVARMTSLSRADLADCVLKLIPDASSHRTWVDVTGNAWF